MATGIKATRQQVSFSADQEVTSISLSKHDQEFSEGAFVGWGAIRLSPNVPLDFLGTSVGTVSLTDQVYQEDVVDVLTFNNSKSASISGSALSEVSLEVLYIKMPEGSEDVGVNFVLDDKGNVLASSNVFAIVLAKYTKTYRLLAYKPKQETGTYDSWFLDSYGFVIAVKDNSMVTYEVEPPSRPGNPPERIMLYKITSTILVNSAGAWEKPIGWPSSSWPSSSAPQNADDPHFAYERIHETGYIRKFFGTVEKDVVITPNHWAWEQPWEGSLVWEPEYNISYVSSKSFPPQYADSYASIDWATLYKYLDATYGKHK